MQILTGDIGGTNTRLALYHAREGKLKIEQNSTFASTSFDSLEAVVIRFLDSLDNPKPEAAAFGVAGPVKQGVSHITNLPWVIAQRNLSQLLELDAVFLLNDLEALAWGIETLDPGDLVTLQQGEPEPGANRAVIAAGTGLGQAGLVKHAEGYRPFATEGGHGDFAAATPREWQLLQFLQARHGHVSWERLVSGPGLVTLYEFLLEQDRSPPPDWLCDPEHEPAAAITERALAGRDALCVECLRWFVRLYGAEAGNLALKMKCSGGLYLGGGIAPKILPALQDGFIEAFLDKGRMRGLLDAMPVQVICNAQTTLQGLARYAELGAR